MNLMDPFTGMPVLPEDCVQKHVPDMLMHSVRHAPEFVARLKKNCSLLQLIHYSPTAPILLPDFNSQHMDTGTVKTIKDDLAGFISVKFKKASSFDDVCARYIPGYEPGRFEPLAVRFYFGAESSVTFYALDKMSQGESRTAPDKIPVKKFKIPAIPMSDLMLIVEECNFTLSTGKHALEEMEVINK
jgi:hypothetical protein